MMPAGYMHTIYNIYYMADASAYLCIFVKITTHNILGSPCTQQMDSMTILTGQSKVPPDGNHETVIIPSCQALNSTV